MTPERAIWRNPWLRLSLVVAAGVCASGCASAGKVNPLTYGGIDPNSPVAADIATAERTPGPMPRFAQAPPAPKDVRPATAWRDSVAETWNLKRRTEAEAAAIPFALAVGDTEAWAAPNAPRFRRPK